MRLKIIYINSIHNACTPPTLLTHMDYILKYNDNLPTPSISDIVIYSGLIFVASNIIFMTLFNLFDIDINKTAEAELAVQYAQWNNKKIKPWTVLISEIVNSIIYSPISEELFFRFFIMKVLGDKFKLPFITINIIQALLFSSIHMTNELYTDQTNKYTQIQCVSAFISAFISGYVYRQTNSILPSIISHIFNNMVASGSEIISYFKFYNDHKSTSVNIV